MSGDALSGVAVLFITTTTTDHRYMYYYSTTVLPVRTVLPYVPVYYVYYYGTYQLYRTVQGRAVVESIIIPVGNLVVIASMVIMGWVLISQFFNCYDCGCRVVVGKQLGGERSFACS